MPRERKATLSNMTPKVACLGGFMSEGGGNVKVGGGAING